MFDVFRCFVFTAQLIPILGELLVSHGNAVVSAPVWCQFHHFTKNPSPQIVTKVPRLQGAFPKETAPDGRPARRQQLRRRVSPDISPDDMAGPVHQTRAVPPPALTGRLTGGGEPPGGRGGLVVRYWRASLYHPYPNNASKLFLVF